MTVTQLHPKPKQKRPRNNIYPDYPDSPVERIVRKYGIKKAAKIVGVAHVNTVYAWERGQCVPSDVFQKNAERHLLEQKGLLPPTPPPQQEPPVNLSSPVAVPHATMTVLLSPRGAWVASKVFGLFGVPVAIAQAPE